MCSKSVRGFAVQTHGIQKTESVGEKDVVKRMRSSGLLENPLQAALTTSCQTRLHIRSFHYAPHQ